MLSRLPICLGLNPRFPNYLGSYIEILSLNGLSLVSLCLNRLFPAITFNNFLCSTIEIEINVLA